MKTYPITRTELLQREQLKGANTYAVWNKKELIERYKAKYRCI